jgi:hypothetical protein
MKTLAAVGLTALLTMSRLALAIDFDQNGFERPVYESYLISKRTQDQFNAAVGAKLLEKLEVNSRLVAIVPVRVERNAHTAILVFEPRDASIGGRASELEALFRRKRGDGETNSFVTLISISTGQTIQLGFVFAGNRVGSDAVALRRLDEPNDRPTHFLAYASIVYVEERPNGLIVHIR